MGVGETGQIIGETGEGKTGVGEMGVILRIARCNVLRHMIFVFVCNAIVPEHLTQCHSSV